MDKPHIYFCKQRKLWFYKITYEMKLFSWHYIEEVSKLVEYLNQKRV